MELVFNLLHNARLARLGSIAPHMACHNLLEIAQLALFVPGEQIHLPHMLVFLLFKITIQVSAPLVITALQELYLLFHVARDSIVPFPGSAICYACPPGHFCNGFALVNPTGLCAGGYYCIFGAMVSNPTDGITGGQCKSPYYCPVGSSTPMTCPDGYYNDQDGQAACFLCPNGYKCVTNTKTICPAKKFCADGAGHPYGQYCLNGTYSSSTGLSAASQCASCPIG